MNFRYIARFKIEATTPLFVGSGDASLITDSLVQKDYLGLPMIPGTSLAGVLRHSMEDFSNDKEKWNKLFGFQGKENEGLGSRLKVSSAYFLNGKGKVAEGFEKAVNNNVFTKLEKLPTRQHVRINHKGVAEDKGLFDHEVLHKGARFIFEIELKGTEADQGVWDLLIEKIKSPAFRVGQGTRNGYGGLRVIGIFNDRYDLNNQEQFEAYLNWDSSFKNNPGLKPLDPDFENKTDYELQLTPDDFFIFSEGFGDQEVDNKPVTEDVMVYNNGKIEFVEQTLIPGSSIKGAIAHRVAFHYNRLNKFFADRINDKVKDFIEENNQAVATIFGKKGEVVDNKNTGQRGILILDDLYYDDIDNDKIFNHVAIDRFTGGGIEGALFSEKVSYKKEKKIILEINLSEAIEDETIEKALEETLKDICRGLLPLGGMTTKGHGMFTGKFIKDGEEIFNYEPTKVEA